jgi:hypothetical protein
MTKKTGLSPAETAEHLKLTTAVEQYLSRGGVINVVPEGESGSVVDPPKPVQELGSAAEMSAKLELLKCLLAKGAGVSALQYSLRMNRNEIKRLASDNGLKIHYSRPVRRTRTPRDRDPLIIDDAVAGHAMHYSTLGYTVQEIAQLLGVGIRDIWNIGKAYRFEFKKTRNETQEAETLSDRNMPLQ